MLKSAVRNDELADWRDCMSCNFRPLALEAFTSPFAGVLSHGWPDELVADGLPCPGDARMPQSMDEVEDSSPEGERNERASRTVALVDDEVGLTDVDGLELQSASRVFSEASKFGI